MDAAAIKLWRRGERARLIALRQYLPAADRLSWSQRIDAELRLLLAERPGILGVYWPFRAEFDPRPLIDWAVATGRGIALPVVVDKKGPLEAGLPVIVLRCDCQDFSFAAASSSLPFTSAFSFSLRCRFCSFEPSSSRMASCAPSPMRNPAWMMRV